MACSQTCIQHGQAHIPRQADAHLAPRCSAQVLLDNNNVLCHTCSTLHEQMQKPMHG